MEMTRLSLGVKLNGSSFHCFDGHGAVDAERRTDKVFIDPTRCCKAHAIGELVDPFRQHNPVD